MRSFSSGTFPTRRLRLQLPGQSFDLEVVADADGLLDALLAKGEQHEDVRDERIPYWADLWPAAVALGRFLLEERARPPDRMPAGPGRSVLEIGCGLGLAGIVAGRLGAEVTLTDYLPDALELARANWARNVERPARFERLDWRRPDPALAADLVLAADVAYEARAFEPLPAAFRALCRPGGRILLAEPDRAVARPFLERLPRLGFRCARHTRTGHLEGLPYRTHILELWPD